MKENAEPIKMNNTDFKKMVAPYKEEALKTWKEIVSIPSVLDPETKTEQMPFGKGVEESLAYVARLGEKLGFKVNRCDNYVTELTYGEGEKIFDIYRHCDVVPVEKEKWTHDPFELTLVDGNTMYGRGSSDDKGPAIACLYAVKALMDNHLLGGYKLRFLFGGNEENDSLCLEHYFHTMKKEYPTLGISPDAEYPLIYAEKSIYAYEADYDISLPHVKDFKLGAALNIVLAEAACEIDDDENKVKEALAIYLEKHQEVKASFENGKLLFLGKPYHGSMPWNGVNAGLHMLHFLGELYQEKTLLTIYENYKDGMGEAFGGNFKDKDFSETSYNIGRISFAGNKLSLFVNLRFPAPLSSDDVLSFIEKKTGAKLTKLGGSDGFVTDKDSDFIRILLNAYQKETGDVVSAPLAIGGGTYARESRNSVAYGAQFVGRDYRMHGHDEFFPLSDFYDNMQIYAHAIFDISEYLRAGKKPF